jgi:hypothetical protein
VIVMRALLFQDRIRTAVVVQLVGLFLLTGAFFGVSSFGIGMWMLGIGLLLVGVALYLSVVLTELRQRQAI